MKTDPSIHKALEADMNEIAIKYAEHHGLDIVTATKDLYPTFTEPMLALLSREIRKARLDEAYIASGGEFFMHNGKYYKDREILRERLRDLQEGKI